MSISTRTTRQHPLPGVVEPPPIPGRRIATMLLLRLALFALFQATTALMLAASGTPDAWAASAAWWPLTASATNVVTLALLARWTRLEGGAMRDYYIVDRSRVRRDVPAVLLLVLAAAVLAAGPNIGLATLLWGDAQVSLDLLVRPLPMWAAMAAVVLFPVTTAMAELPTYYGYVQPRLAARGLPATAVIAVPALFHALQHVTLPLLLDAQFLTWRALMFVPFALLVSWALRRRPALLPYLLVVHLLLDLQMALMVLGAAAS